MKKTLYIQPKVKVVKIDVEEAILTFSNTCIEKKNVSSVTYSVGDIPFHGTAISTYGTDNGQNLQSRGTSFDFADE